MSALAITSVADSIESLHLGYELPASDLRDLLPASPVDRERLLDQCLSSMSFALMMLEEFTKSSPARLAAFDAALANHNFVAIASQAHALKGVAGILAADTLLQSCSQLESAAKSDDKPETHALVQRLHHEVQRVIDFIPTLQASA